MLWLVFALSAAFFSGVTRIIHKHVLRTEHPFAYAFIQNMLVGVLLLPFALARWQTPVGWWPWALVLISSILWNGIALSVFYSYRYTPVSVRDPLKQTELIVIFILSVLLLGESVTAGKLIGAALVVVGGLLLTYHKERFFGHLQDRGIQLTLLSVLFASLAAVVDKAASQYFGAVQYTFLLFLVPGLLMLPWIRGYTSHVNRALRGRPFGIAGMVCTSLLAFLFMIFAFQHGDLTIVAPVTKLSLLVSVGGSMLFFADERVQWVRRVAAAILMILGAVFVSGALA